MGRSLETGRALALGWRRLAPRRATRCDRSGELFRPAGDRQRQPASARRARGRDLQAAGADAGEIRPGGSLDVDVAHASGSDQLVPGIGERDVLRGRPCTERSVERQPRGRGAHVQKLVVADDVIAAAGEINARVVQGKFLLRRPELMKDVADDRHVPHLMARRSRRSERHCRPMRGRPPHGARSPCCRRCLGS